MDIASHRLGVPAILPAMNARVPLPGSFRPVMGFGGAHAQTILGKVLRSRNALPLERERWTTPDGDFLDLDFAPDPDPRAPLLLVLHGLEGNARRGYCMESYRAAAEVGMAAVGLNFRACSGEPNLRARAYHSGETGDLAFVLRSIRERFPSRPLVILGFSLGGNVLLKYLGESGAHEPTGVCGAAVVSVPYDLEAGAARLETTTMGRLVYTRYFLRSLVDKVEQKSHLVDDHGMLAGVRGARTIRAFDDALTAPLHGFVDAGDYYRRSSSTHFLEEIRVPTLLLHSMDDPFLPPSAVPVRAMESNPALHPVLTDRGGHVGFIAGRLGRPRFWAEESAAAFLAGVARAP